MTSVAIIQFPGTNCEYETLEACRFYGISAFIHRWNLDICLDDISGFILPGGFSYQDRVRAGVIASKLPIMDKVMTFANQGKPVLGICNGCQILAETGLLPSESNFSLSMALSKNVYDEKYIGFICDWVYLKAFNSQNSLFTKYFSDNDVIPMPINHGEGNFVFDLDQVEFSKLSMFKYVDIDGRVLSKPLNGSYNSIAGISNGTGNVFAMMPHPERSAFLRQIPRYFSRKWSDKQAKILQDSPGSSEKIFLALKEALS